jgi:ATP-dependent exoDNAse (exonuclease V) beta subunit
LRYRQQFRNEASNEKVRKWIRKLRKDPPVFPTTAPTSHPKLQDSPSGVNELSGESIQESPSKKALSSLQQKFQHNKFTAIDLIHSFQTVTLPLVVGYDRVRQHFQILDRILHLRYHISVTTSIHAPISRLPLLTKQQT